MPDAQGVERKGTLMSATASESESSVWCVYALEDGKQVIVRGPLTEAELAAYRRHPETFFGVEQHVGGKLRNVMDAFNFFLEGYAGTSREGLLKFMAGHADIAELRALSRDDLAEVYAERCALSIPQPAHKPPSNSA